VPRILIYFITNKSTDVVKQEKETSYIYGVALITEVPLQLALVYYFIAYNFISIIAYSTPYITIELYPTLF